MLWLMSEDDVHGIGVVGTLLVVLVNVQFTFWVTLGALSIAVILSLFLSSTSSQCNSISKLSVSALTRYYQNSALIWNSTMPKLF